MITVNITPPNLYNNPPSIPTEDDSYPDEEAAVAGRIQFPSPEYHLPLSHHQPVETVNTMPQSQEGMSPSTENTCSAFHLAAGESMKRIGPIDGSNTWETAVRRIKWLMETLGPIAEVRMMPF